MDLQQLFSRLRELSSTLTPSQILSLALAFILVVSIVSGSALWLNKPTYALLFADMDPETAGQIVTRLKNANIAYQLDEGGRGIRVPAERVDELRLELTAQGMPSSGRVGFEIFDRTAFGATEFLEQVNYRRALEGELARTIANIDEVAGARVHIAMGRDSLFGESRPAKASVVLKLRGSRSLAAPTISGISNLVAASVEGLRPEAVVILDSYGRPLARPEGDESDPLGAAQAERQQRLEREMAGRVVTLLEPVVGSNRVRVNVALKLNAQALEETQELWDPNAAVVRSRQTTADMAGMGAGVAGVAGARGNIPPPVSGAPGAQPPAAPASAAPAMAAGPGSSRSGETTNYEISRTTRRTVQPPGEIARVSVAVIIDDNQIVSPGENGQTQVTREPRKQEDLQKLHDLVAAAVGLEPDRGDQLTVQNISFDETPPVEEATPPSTLQRYAPQIWDASRMAGVLIIGIIALFVFVRPIMRGLGAAAAPARQVAVAVAAPAAAGQVVRTVADLESEIEAQIDAAAAQRLSGRKLPVLTKKVSTLSSNDPENVAKLLRSWINESER